MNLAIADQFTGSPGFTFTQATSDFLVCFTDNPFIISFLRPIISLISFFGSLDRTVGIATGYGTDDGGVGVPSPRTSNNYLFSASSRPVLGPTQRPIRWVLGAL
jgi:hypothetical protein